MERHTPSAVIAELYQLFGEGRLDETFALMDPDVRLVEPGDEEVLPWGGEFRGHEGLRAFYDGLARGLSHIEIDADTLEITDLGDGRVLVLATERGTASATGRTYESRSAWVWTVEDGRIVDMRAFHDTGAMAAAMA